ncbi:DNA cytosine methyltransferase [Mesorhizobium sp. CA13]|uniref:DNA cytosine methyltransferase n=1 Tax=Mesorhizobium sp. CA13 TaxID=2876643 RepID=UPI001CCD956E|nr:DNA cytosine methyltransferase [Mesorhizobium sp. CA13]MBZ9852815.1 DNA cytosine methyltransferase [Mesorhizobium sp. CA13]
MLLDFEARAAQIDYPPLIMDSFAGGGGASTGIEMALGRSPDIAINHNPAALALHAANHPETLHLSENVYKVDPLDYVAGKHIGLAWFSPDCKHFSKAKGGKPVERNIRDLAWIIPGWVERIQKSGGGIDVVILENVEEFQDWGPLVETEKGLMPNPQSRGLTFQKWCKALRALGGKIEHRELRACDYGAPTIRKRLFIIIRFDGKKIVWPKPTHGKPDDPDVIAGRKLLWRTAAEIIDFSLPCPSIFDTTAEVLEKHGLRAVRPLAAATMSRVARGVDRYVLKAKRPFLVDVAHGEVSPSGVKRWGNGFRSVDNPLSVVTAGGINHAVVAPTLIGCGGRAGQSRPRGGDEPMATQTAKADVCVAAAFLAQNNYQEPGHDAREPVSTIVQKGSTQSVVSAFISRQFGTSIGHDMDEPTHTATAKVNKSMLVAPFMQKYYGTGDGARVDDPCHSVTTKDRFGFVEGKLGWRPFTEAQAAQARQVAAFMRAHGFWDEREFVTIDIAGETFTIVDIGMRMLTPRELFCAQGFPPDYIIDLEFNGKPLPKSDQISCCGNSVSPPMAAALVAANCGHLIRYREAAE